MTPKMQITLKTQSSRHLNIAPDVMRCLFRARFFERLDDLFSPIDESSQCDCEILYNVAESSRLKAKHWRGVAEGLNDSVGLKHQKAGQ
jgi:hypothetical protein